MSNHFDVIGLGQCSLDFIGTLSDYPERDQKVELEELLVQGGGPTATALVTLSRLGIATAILGRVGADDYGRKIRQGLEAEKVDCGGLLTGPDGSSQVAFIAVDAAGNRNIFWHRGSVKPLVGPDVNCAVIAAAKVLLLDGLQLEASLVAAEVARAQNVVTVLDGGTFRDGTVELLGFIDHLVVSERFARQAGGKNLHDILQKLLAYGADAVTVTMGGGGSMTLEANGTCCRMPAFPMTPVDTTGCGDVFHGAYIYGLLEGWPVPETVRFAGACAALKTRALGGRTAIPNQAEVRDFLALHDTVQPILLWPK